MDEKTLNRDEIIERSKWYIYGYFALMDDIFQIPDDHWVDIAPDWELNIYTDPEEEDEDQVVLHIHAVLYQRYRRADRLDDYIRLFDLEENLEALVERDETIWMA